MVIFNKMRYLVPELKMQTYMHELHKWNKYHKEKTTDHVFIERVTYEVTTTSRKYTNDCGDRPSLLLSKLRTVFNRIEKQKRDLA